jgi:hypothetical protein
LYPALENIFQNGMIVIAAQTNMIANSNGPGIPISNSPFFYSTLRQAQYLQQVFIRPFDFAQGRLYGGGVQALEKKLEALIIPL